VDGRLGSLAGGRGAPFSGVHHQGTPIGGQRRLAAHHGQTDGRPSGRAKQGDPILARNRHADRPARGIHLILPGGLPGANRCHDEHQAAGREPDQAPGEQIRRALAVEGDDRSIRQQGLDPSLVRPEAIPGEQRHVQDKILDPALPFEHHRPFDRGDMGRRRLIQFLRRDRHRRRAEDDQGQEKQGKAWHGHLRTNRRRRQGWQGNYSSPKDQRCRRIGELAL